MTDYIKQGFIAVPREEKSRKLAIRAHNTAGTWDSRRPSVPWEQVSTTVNRTASGTEW